MNERKGLRGTEEREKETNKRKLRGNHGKEMRRGEKENRDSRKDENKTNESKGEGCVKRSFTGERREV